MGGCAASKLADEDAVRRCRDRRRLIKRAVAARHHLAAAHSDYLRSLLLAASSLSSFAAGEPFAVSSYSPSVLLPRPPPPAAASSDPRRRSFPPNPPSVSTEDGSSSAWNWEDYYPPSPPGSEFFAGEVGAGREAAQWGHGRFASSSSSDISGSDDEGADLESRSHFELRGPAAESEVGSSSASAAGGVAGMELAVRHRDLAEIMAAVEESFNGAAAAGEPVSVLLETGRKQLDRSIGQLRKTVYHSNSIISALSSSWTSKPPLAIRYKSDIDVSIVSSNGKSHCSTLEQLLAWEKKLYEEIKTREGLKIEHEKKLSSLQSQECRGLEDAKLVKTKSSIKKLQSLMVVTSQAVSSASVAIIEVRDNELAPQLVELCHGLMLMWRSMNRFHEIQNNIIQQVKGLVNRPISGESTSDLHRQVTSHLVSAVSAWHSSFCHLINYQREYVTSLHGWLKLTLLNVEDYPDQNSSSDTAVASDLFAFCDEWKQALDRVPDTVASEAIKSFVQVVNAISEKQAEEVKIKKRAEHVSKELEKKSAALRNIEKKFYRSYSMVGIGLPGPESAQALDAGDPLAEKRAELTLCRRRVEDELARHVKAVEITRSMTLNNIQTGLPGVFQAMTGFSGVLAEALEGVYYRTVHV